MTPAQAYTIASAWGSYLHSGDPGACFYGFCVNDGRPQSEAHRAQCLRYTADLLAAVETRSAKREIMALEQWFLSAPLQDNRFPPAPGLVKALALVRT